MTKAPNHKHPVARHERPDSGDAFIPDPGEGPAHTRDDLAEELAEEFLTSATSAEESLPDALDRRRAADLPMMRLSGVKLSSNRLRDITFNPCRGNSRGHSEEDHRPGEQSKRRERLP